MRVSVLKKGLPLAVVAAVALLGLIGAVPASAASPWWQVLTGSRPTNMWEPKDATETQEVTAEEFFGVFAAIEVKVGGKAVGCLGAGNLEPFGGPSADKLCEAETGFPASETAEEFEEMLEGPYGTGVKVTGGPVGGAPFVVKSSWRPPIEVRVIEINFFGAVRPMGSASAKVTSKDSGRLTLAITNLGDAPVDATAKPVTVVDKLPEGVSAVGIAIAAAGAPPRPVECLIPASDEVSCTFKGKLPPYEAMLIEIDVVLTGEPPAEGTAGEVTVSGGNASPAGDVQRVRMSPEPTPFGIERFSAQSEEEGGAVTPQAGAHPFQFTNTIQINSGRYVSGEKRVPDSVELPALPRNLRFPLPAGLIGNVQGLPQCPTASFFEKFELINKCPDSSAIGIASVTFDEPGILGYTRLAVPVFNLPPAHGEPARFGMSPGGLSVVIDTAVDPDNEYRIIASVSNIPQISALLSATTTFWGTPGDPRHDISRGWGCAYFSHPGPCERPPGLGEAPLFRQPVSCSAPLDFGLELEPWNVPLGSEIDKAEATQPNMIGCNRVPFDPTISAAPTSKLAENPSGLDFKLTMPNSGLLNKEAIAEGQPEKVEVTLPEGVTINPSEGEGLVPCTSADYSRETAASRPGEGCPEASKIGNVQISTPLLGEELNGALYLATPYENQFHSLVALYLVARAPERGVVVKLAGKVVPNPVTGQLMTIFEDTPQLPFSSFRLHFREGGRAPLVTPPACGTYQTVATMLPWSAASLTDPAPDEIVTRTSSFTIEHGVDGGACPAGGTPPFAPQVVAGTQNNAGGSYSPFYMRIMRKDGEQELTKFTTVMPPGLTGNLTGIPFCPESAIMAARERSSLPNGGALEQAEPSCPAASEIGRSLVGAGVGSVLAYTPGKIYLAGPYHGAGLSIVSVTSATVGPFDLGTVVIRFALKINPITAQVEVDATGSDPIPHIIQGIVVHVRDIRVYIDRSKFMLNPTSCARMTSSATVSGSGASFASSADDVPVTVGEPFQAADCQSLKFKPLFKASTSGKTSRAKGASLHVTLTYPKEALGNDTNIHSVKVDLPKQLPSRLTTLQKACVDSVFEANPANCPAESKVGTAKAITPILPVPLIGPAYFVSHGGAKFPELIVVLQGYGITIDLHGETFISKAGITSSTFRTVPDQPVTSFELTLPQGPSSALAANGNLCASTLTMPTAFTGQNGMTLKQSTPIEVTGCPYSLRIVHRSVKKRVLTLKVSVPVAGRIVASGKGVSRGAKTAKGRSTLTLTLKERRAGKLRTKVLLRFTPAKGKQRKILRKSITVSFH